MVAALAWTPATAAEVVDAWGGGFWALIPFTMQMSLIIITGLAVWNDFQFSLFFLQRKAVMTVPLVLSQFISMYQSDIAWVAAGCLIAVLPMAAVYFFLQKYFVSGLAEAAIKG